MADQRRGEQLCEHLLSRQVRRSGGAGKPAFAGSDLREDGDVWPSDVSRDCAALAGNVTKIWVVVSGWTPVSGFGLAALPKGGASCRYRRVTLQSYSAIKKTSC